MITGYLLYTLYETFNQVRVNGDFYRVLGVSPIASERTIKSRFRRLAALHHPDKVGNNGGMSEGSDYFVFLKLAQDTLLDPAKRFAYDRFGPDIVNWGSQQQSMRDYLYTALQKSILSQYVGGFLTLIFLNFTWWSDWGRYVCALPLQLRYRIKQLTLTGWQWRFLTFGALLVLEAILITQPLTVFMPTLYIPTPVREVLGINPDDKSHFYLLPFQILTMARQVSITLHIFISQLTPPELSKKSSSASSTPGDRLSTQTMQRLAQLLHLSRTTDAEASRLLQMGYAPFHGDKQATATLRKGMKEGLVLNSVRASPEVQSAVNAAIQRRKEE